MDQRVCDAPVRLLGRLGNSQTVAENSADRTLNNTHQFIWGARLLCPRDGDQIDVALQAAVNRDGVALKLGGLPNGRKDGIQKRSTVSARRFADRRDIVDAHSTDTLASPP